MPIDVAIVNINPRPSKRGDPTDEHVLIVNRTRRAVDLSGWILRDDRNHRYIFPQGFTLQPFNAVSVWTGTGTSDNENLFMGRHAAVWNNRGDRAFLAAADGEMVSRFVYGLSTTAREIEADNRAEEFAPIFQFHSEEEYFPSSVEWYLERCALKTITPYPPPPALVNGLSLGTDTPPTAETVALTVEILPVGQVTPDALVAQASESTETPWVWLDLQDDQESREGHLDSAPVYVRALDRSEDAGEGIVDFQYWVFYPYSGNISHIGHFAHEGDWEHVTVRTRDDKILGVYTSAHDEDEHRWHGPLSVKRDGNRPIIFVAGASHAAYVTAGKQPRDDWKPDDETDKGGPRWDGALLQRLKPPPTWLSFSGRWGSPGLTSFTSGPFGPPLKKTWRGEAHGPPGWICFYEGDDMGEDIVKWASDRPGQVLYGDAHFTNDEIRSVQLFGVRPGAEIRLFNDKQGDRSKGYCRITVKRFLPSIKIRRLETDQADRDSENVRVLFSGDELAGKVSRIEVD